MNTAPLMASVARPEWYLWFCYGAGLLLMGRTGRYAWGLVGFAAAACLLLSADLQGRSQGYGLPVEPNHRRAASFVLDPWKQDKVQNLPSFWDRGERLARARGLALGASPLSGIAAGSTTLQAPLYEMLMALVHTLSGWDMVLVYDWSSLAALLAVMLALYFWGSPGEPERRQARLQGLCMGFCLVFLSSPWPHLEAVARVTTLATFWNAFVLLQPQFLLAFSLLPPCLALLARPERSATVGAGLCLAGMLLLAPSLFWLACLALLMALPLARWRGVRTLSGVRMGVAVLTALAMSSWWWVPLALQAWEHWSVVSWPEAFYSVRTMLTQIPWLSLRRLYDPIADTVALGPLFWLGVPGLALLWKRGRPADLLLLGLVSTAYGLRLLVFPLIMKMGGDLYYADQLLEMFLRPSMALVSGVTLARLTTLLVERRADWSAWCVSRTQGTGVLRVMVRPCCAWLARPQGQQGRIAALLFLLVTPCTLAVWYAPEENFWSQTRNGQGPECRERLISWVRGNTGPEAVFWTGRATGAALATETGRKLLLAPPLSPEIFARPEREALVKGLLRGEHPQELARFAPLHLVWDASFQADYPQQALSAILQGNRPRLQWSSDDCSVYLLE